MTVALSPVSAVQALPSLRDNQLLQAVSGLASSSLSAQQEVLRTLAVLLTGDDSGTSQAVRLHLATAARNEHFREQVGSEVTAPSLRPLPFLSVMLLL